MNSIKVFSPASVSNVCCGFDVLGFSIEGVGDDIFIQKSNSKGIKIKRVTGYKIPIDGKKNTACVAAKALLEKNPEPTETEARYWLAGNLCRCTGYDKIMRSVMAAAEEMRGA